MYGHLQPQPATTLSRLQHTPKANAETIFLLLILLLLLAVAAVAYTQQNQQNTTPIVTPPTLTAEPSLLDWGNLTRYQTATRNVTLTNLGDIDTEPLNMTNTCLIGTVLWNAENTTLPAHASKSISFSLRISPSAPTGPFNFTITIIG